MTRADPLRTLGLSQRTYKAVERWFLKRENSGVRPTIGDALDLYNEFGEYTMLLIRDFGPVAFDEFRAALETYQTSREI